MQQDSYEIIVVINTLFHKVNMQQPESGEIWYRRKEMTESLSETRVGIVPAKNHYTCGSCWRCRCRILGKLRMYDASQNTDGSLFELE